MIHDGHLARRLGPDETLTSIVLDRWLSWGINRTEESYLLMKKDVHQFNPDKVHPFVDNVKMSEFGSKSFQGVQLRIDTSRMTQYSKVPFLAIELVTIINYAFSEEVQEVPKG